MQNIAEKNHIPINVGYSCFRYSRNKPYPMKTQSNLFCLQLYLKKLMKNSRPAVVCLGCKRSDINVIVKLNPQYSFVSL